MAITNQKQLKKEMSKWSNGMKDVYAVSDKCVKKLISNGKTPADAQAAVLEILKESEQSLRNKDYGFVAELLEMTFLNKDLKDININKVLGI